MLVNQASLKKKISMENKDIFHILQRLTTRFLLDLFLSNILAPPNAKMATNQAFPPF